VLSWSHGKTRPPIGNNDDLWMAAHAVALGVAMNNEREFRRIPGPSVENWLNNRKTLLSLLPDSATVSAPTSNTSANFVVEGAIPESAKDKVPGSVRYRSLTEEK